MAAAGRRSIAPTRLLAQAARGAGRQQIVRPIVRQFTSSSPNQKEVASAGTDSSPTPNMRFAPRGPTGELKAPVVNPTDKYQDKAAALHTYGQYLMSCMPKFIQSFSVWKDELCIYIPPQAVIPVFTFLKNHSSAEYKQISDITAVDFPTKANRFEVVYNMLSVRHNSRIRVKTYADEASPVPSICGLYDAANWYEREVYDLFGVFFLNHPDLRRIMTDYGFEGHPLRKDFPMSGYTEIRWSEEKKRIITEPLEMTQAYRNFAGGSAAWEQVGPGQDRTPDQYKLPDVAPEPKKEEPKK